MQVAVNSEKLFDRQLNLKKYFLIIVNLRYTINLMKTKEFTQIIGQHPNKQTSFWYNSQQLVPNHYHITEIKKNTTESVDCGKTIHRENTTIVQLWSEEADIATHQLNNTKIASIFAGMDARLKLHQEADIIFEFGDDNNRTSNYKIEKVDVLDEALIFHLYVPQTECKPKKLLNSLTSCCEPSCCS